MNTAIAKVEPAAPAELAPTRGAYIVADALVQETEQHKLLGQYVAHHMTEGTDYGVIPGTKTRTLFKPGAEKLTQLFRCIARFRIEEKIENWDTGLFYYRFSCQIVTQAEQYRVVAEGVGSCSTFESRYRWRTADRTCPACGNAAICRSKFPPRNQPQAEPGWYCFAKRGGCGANFDADDSAISSQPTGRVQNPDLIDQVNTVLKMAKKRALVDAAIALARCSDIFTQDMEDHSEPADHAAGSPQPQQAAGNALPANGQELHRRLQEYDAKLAAQKLCVRGALLAHVTQAGVKAGYPGNMSDWTGPAISFAVAAVKQFEQNLRHSEPSEDLQLLRTQVEAEILDAGTDLATVLRTHAKPLGIDSARPLPTLDSLTPAQLEFLINALAGGQPAEVA